MVVRVHVSGVHPPLSRHSKVEDDRVAPVGMDEAELAAPAERRDGRTRQPLAQAGRKVSAKVGPAKLDSRDFTAEQHLFQSADRGFDFGEFGHFGHMANVAAAS
jgi:hypothetical protein